MDENLVNKMKITFRGKLLRVWWWLRKNRYRFGFLFRNDLHKLAVINGTDKLSLGYIDHYALHLSKFKRKRFNLLEIGVGGYKGSLAGGESLRMWKTYFPRANVFGIDIYDKSRLEETRIKTFQGHQAEENFLERVVAETGGIDVVIDDGSHVSEDVIRSFCFLFPKLSDGGIYVVEDLQTSYYPDYPDPGVDLNARNDVKTSMGFFKSLLDGFYYKDFKAVPSGYEPSYFDKKIVAMHFYHNLLFIYKGDNDRTVWHLSGDEPPG